jgi:hypothetical protein
MSSKIFEEAIADAKKLREVAEENAKRAIIEAVTPRIREFIEGELLDNPSDKANKVIEESVDKEDELTLDEGALKKLATLLGADVVESIQESNTQNDFLSSVSDAVSSLTDDQREELLKIADKINEEKRSLSSNQIDNNDLQENSNMSNKNYEVDLAALREAVEAELSEMSEEDTTTDTSTPLDEQNVDELEEMLQELKLVLDLGDGIEEDQVPEELRGMLELDDDEDEEVELEDEEAADDEEDLEGEEASEEEEDEPMDFQALAEGDPDETVEIDETMLAEELVRIRLAIQEGKVDHHFGGKGETKAGVDGSFGGKGSGKSGVKKSFGGGTEGADAFTNPPDLNKLAEAIRGERRKNRALDEKLTKYRSAVKTLREQLEDLNLFNAKLLYVNKLLQNKSLSESEKKSVIKALDEAHSLSEAKSLYKSLTETFTRGSKDSLVESRTRGSSSKPTTSSAPTKSGPPELARWQRLAGLK